MMSDEELGKGVHSGDGMSFDPVWLKTLAEKSGVHWRTALDDAISNGQLVFVRFGNAAHDMLGEVGEMDGTTIDQLSDFDSLCAYWQLPQSELRKLPHNDPPWKIHKVMRPAVFGDDSEQKKWLEAAPPVDENMLYLERQQAASSKRKPHTAFVAHEMKAGTRRADAWGKLKRLASKSLGTTQVQLLGYGPIFLKRDRQNPESVLRYKHSKFEEPEDGELIKKGAFNTAWTAEKKGNMKET